MWQAESSREQMAHSQRAQTTLRDGVDAGNSLSGYLLPPPDAGPGQGCSVPGRAGSCSFPWGAVTLGRSTSCHPDSGPAGTELRAKKVATFTPVFFCWGLPPVTRHWKCCSDDIAHKGSFLGHQVR